MVSEGPLAGKFALGGGLIFPSPLRWPGPWPGPGLIWVHWQVGIPNLPGVPGHPGRCPPPPHAAQSLIFNSLAIFSETLHDMAQLKLHGQDHSHKRTSRNNCTGGYSVRNY
eukprot:371581-Rhodomonas_salina.1